MPYDPASSEMIAACSLLCYRGTFFTAARLARCSVSTLRNRLRQRLDLATGDVVHTPLLALEYLRSIGRTQPIGQADLAMRLEEIQRPLGADLKALNRGDR